MTEHRPRSAVAAPIPSAMTPVMLPAPDDENRWEFVLFGVIGGGLLKGCLLMLLILTDPTSRRWGWGAVVVLVPLLGIAVAAHFETLRVRCLTLGLIAGACGATVYGAILMLLSATVFR